MLIDHNTKKEKLQEIITRFEPRYIFLGKEIDGCLIDNYKKLDNDFFNNIYKIK